MTKVVFLDRDGPINVDRGYVHRLEDWQWQPGAIEAMKALQQAGYALAIITNQSGVGHGLYPESDVTSLHAYMESELGQHGVSVAIAYCPHRRDGTCECRKPKTGMAKQIEQMIGPIDYAASWTVGDKIADLLFGKNLHTGTILLRSRYWQESELPQQPNYIVGTLTEAASKIVKGQKTQSAR